MAKTSTDVKTEINKAFQETFRLIFGEECKLELDDLNEYMWRYHYPIYSRKSVITPSRIEDLKFVGLT